MMLRTPGATKVLGAGGLLLTAALGWILAIGPQVSALAEVRLEIEETQDQNALLVQQLAALEQQSREVGASRRTARDLAAQLPPTADLPGLFRAVTAAVVEAGIGARGVTTLAPTAPVVSGADPTTGLPPADGPAAMLARQTVSVAVSGTYDQTRQLLENLEQMARAYLITTVALSTGEDTGTFVTSLTGVMFVMAPVTVPDPPHDDARQTGG
jgi:Tfp pilus assembly protein PilO